MIRVLVVEFGRSPYYKLRWKDPISGKVKHKAITIKTSDPKGKKEANRLAAQLEADLNSGRYADIKNLSWKTFTERYLAEHMASASQAYIGKVIAVFNSIELILQPKHVGELTSSKISYFASEMLKGRGNWIGPKKTRVERPRSKATIKSNLATIRTALRWAEAIGLITKAPKIAINNRDGDKAKGRPITREEFEHMLDVAPKIAGSITTELKRLMDLAWYTGMRLQELTMLSWDNYGTIHIDWSGKYPVVVFPSKFNKNRKDQTVPLTPEAAEWLSQTPKNQRVGLVAGIPNRLKPGTNLLPHHIGKLVAQIGKRANVKVSSPEDRIRFASLHDLRRSFGDRWSQKVMPNVLCQLMRHSSIETTQKFYLNRNSQVTAAMLWQQHGPTEQPAKEGSEDHRYS